MEKIFKYSLRLALVGLVAAGLVAAGLEVSAAQAASGNANNAKRVLDEKAIIHVLDKS
jgi:hypothetical protein